jgi:hypothetical protein
MEKPKCDKSLKDGRPCSLGAVYIIEDVYYCGIHARSKKLSTEEKEEYKITTASQLRIQANLPPPLFSESYTSQPQPQHRPQPIISTRKRNNEAETEISIVRGNGGGGGGGGGGNENDDDYVPPISQTPSPTPLPPPKTAPAPKKKRVAAKTAVAKKAKTGDEAESSGGVSSGSGKKYTKEEKLFLDIYSSIIKHIEEGTVPEELSREDTSLIMEMEESSEEAKIAIIGEATRLAGTRESVSRVMLCLTKAIFAYQKALNEQRANPSIQHHQYDYMEPIKAELKKHTTTTTMTSANNEGASNGTYQLLETGNVVYFPEVDMTIINCNPHVLQSYGYASFEEWTSKPTSVFMFNNEWYIPARDGFPFRAKQNIEDAKEILKNIDKQSGTDASGEASAVRDTKEKYLQLIGKTLGCFCSPANCHCEVYVLVVSSLKGIQVKSLMNNENLE